MTVPFSLRLRESTSTIHSDVENRGFMVDLMEGRLDARAYAVLLTQYEIIYSALEDRVSEFDTNPVFAPFADVRLGRHTRIVHDLQRLGPTEIPLAEASLRYAQRLREISRPEELLAHHYTRYLGDLSGGLAIGALMSRRYGITAEALTMWDFAEIGKTKPYKDVYRSKLDAVKSTGGDEDLVISETFMAFDLNGQMLSEILGFLTPGTGPAGSSIDARASVA